MGFPLNDLPDACVILDENDRVTDINPAGERLFELVKAQTLGKTLAELCFGRARCLIPDKSMAGRNENAASHLTDELSGHVEIKVSALHAPDGRLLGRITILRFIETSSHEEALSRRNEMLMALQETTLDLHASLDLEVVLHNIVERACKLLGTMHGYVDILRESGELEPVVGVGALSASTRFKVSLGQGLAGTVWKTGKPLFIPDYDRWPGRIGAFPRGMIRAILGVPLLSKGHVVGVIGVARGVESDISFSEEDIDVLMRFADLAVLALENARLFQQAQAEIAYRRKTEMDLRDANQVLQFQIEKVELLQGQLRDMAVRDTLTNLFNRRYLQETLQVELARANRSGASLAILMMDCDNLKQINDTYGHKSGDDSLVHIADVIRESIRAGDVACRYGGDEFVVILGDVTEKIAFERAENLRNRVCAKPILHRNGKIEVRVSIGIAMFPAHGPQAESLLHKADQALYAAKREGKNRVLVYSDELEARG